MHVENHKFESVHGCDRPCIFIHLLLSVRGSSVEHRYGEGFRFFRNKWRRWSLWIIDRLYNISRFPQHHIDPIGKVEIVVGRDHPLWSISFQILNFHQKLHQSYWFGLEKWILKWFSCSSKFVHDLSSKWVENRTKSDQKSTIKRAKKEEKM